MSTRRREAAEVPSGHRGGGVNWLVLEYDPGSGGWFLFGHRALEEPSLFDIWHLTRDEALQEAGRQWGVRQDQWDADRS